MKEAFKLFALFGVILVIIAAVLNALFVKRFLVQNNGMAPTMVYGDEVLAWTRFGVDTGDVLVCKHPGREGEYVFGRVIAHPGQTLSTDHNGTLYIDGQRTNVDSGGNVEFYDVTRKKQFTMQWANMEYSARLTRPFFIETGRTFSLREYRVDRGLYLLGDNRSDDQHDSRTFGEVIPDDCYGQVFLRWKPAPPTGDDIDHGYLDWIK
jgi:signal peptidase I